jgi:hypothetical protein
MSPRRFTRSTLLLLAGGALTLVPFPIHGAGRVDLDTLSDEELLQDLDAEEARDFQRLGYGLDRKYPIEVLEDHFLQALADAGGPDDADDVITFAGLQQEMAEANITLQSLVDAALREADSEMSFDGSPLPGLANPDDSPVAEPLGSGQLTWRQAHLRVNQTIIRNGIRAGS